MLPNVACPPRPSRHPCSLASVSPVVTHPRDSRSKSQWRSRQSHHGAARSYQVDHRLVRLLHEAHPLGLRPQYLTTALAIR
eukprot:953377-Rhodomonas_salina.5